jgi:hypothetical protein
MRRRVIELANGRVVRDEAGGMYSQREPTTDEFGALLRDVLSHRDGGSREQQ